MSGPRLQAPRPAGDDREARPYYTPTTVPTTIYVDSANGDDVSGSGSEASPFASLKHAFSVIGFVEDSASGPLTIQLADGHEEALTRFVRDNACAIKGHTEVSATYVVASVETTTIAELSFTLTTPDDTFTEDELVGQRVYQVTQARYGIIVANGATSTGATSITVRQDAIASVSAPSTGQSVQFIDQTSKLTLTEDVILTSNSELTFEHVHFEGSSYVMFFIQTEKVNLKWCKLELLRPHVGFLGNAFFWNCHIKSAGNAGRGVLSMRNGAFANFFRGNVIDCSGVTAANAFIESDKFSSWVYRGGMELIGLGSNGITMREANCQPAEAIGANDVWHFRDCTAGFVITGGRQILPHLLGSVTGAYAVSASGGAYATLGSSSAIGTSGNSNAVSANGGSSAVATAGSGKAETRIENGDPAP